jgi:hypothetical protein
MNHHSLATIGQVRRQSELENGFGGALQKVSDMPVWLRRALQIVVPILAVSGEEWCWAAWQNGPSFVDDIAAWAGAVLFPFYRKRRAS